MIFALHFLGSLASKVSYYSGSIKTVRDLIDHSLDEEPPSNCPGGRVELMPLSDSMTVKDVSFRYNPSLPNSLSDINIDLAQTELQVSGRRFAGRVQAPCQPRVVLCLPSSIL
jgi:ABC-type bacteriocin/lantibiotic exporter with double-glycine peptidase domain